MADARQTWECQGRQYHGWFGDGTCADGALWPDRAEDVAKAAAIRRILAVVYGAVGALPAERRRRWEGWLQRGGAAVLSKALDAWSAIRLHRGEFQSRFLPDGSGERVDTAAHDPADAIRAGEAGASGRLAELIPAVGRDRCSRFISDVWQKIGPGMAAPPQYHEPRGYQEVATGDKTFGLPRSVLERESSAGKDGWGGGRRQLHCIGGL